MTNRNDNKTLRERLIGTWTLLSAVNKSSGGAPDVYPFGKNPKGFIMYTADGYQSSHLMFPVRKSFASEDYFSATNEERAAAAAGYLGYAGPYEVDDKKQMIRHAVDVSLFPNWIGRSHLRLARLEGDLLHLSTEHQLIKSPDGRILTYFLIWKRAVDNPLIATSQR